MPIGGGTFTVQNKILPGAYINFVSMGTNAKMGSRGVAALPLELNWGPDDKVFTMTATDFNATSLKVFGYDPTDANILLVREALKRAKSLLIYRVNGVRMSKSSKVKSASSSRASSESPSSFARTTESRLQSIRRTVCLPAEDSWSSFSTTISK